MAQSGLHTVSQELHFKPYTLNPRTEQANSAERPTTEQ